MEALSRERRGTAIVERFEEVVCVWAWVRGECEGSETGAKYSKWDSKDGGASVDTAILSIAGSECWGTLVVAIICCC